MELDALIGALAPGDVIGRRPVEILDLAYDTRRVADGTLFFCVPGARVAGHDLAGAAVAAGALTADGCTICGQSLTVFGVASVGENPRAHATDASGFSFRVEIDHSPADRVCA